MNKKSDKALVGAAGEHLVLARLLARGILASQAPRGTRKADILVNFLDTDSSCLIQVKTRSTVGGDQGWHMSKKHEEIKDPDLFYCFVDVSIEPAKVYVVPAKKVALAVKESHATWLNTPGKRVKKHKPTDMRRIVPNYKLNLKKFPDGWMEEYLENWKLIENFSA